ncbi:MAG: fibronectin type III domain-containing protein, partial [Spirochaeta sp.]
MKKMLIAGFTVLAVIALIAGCANPLTDADGGVLAVTDLTASAAHDSADISWVEPNGDFASAEVTVSAEGQDDITRTVDKGEAQVSLDSLVPETTYTVSVALVAANGTVSEKAVSKEFTTPAVPAPVAAVIVDITFVGVENGKDYALVGNNYDGFLGATWDENHMATTASN